MRWPGAGFETSALQMATDHEGVGARGVHRNAVRVKGTGLNRLQCAGGKGDLVNHDVVCVELQ